MSLVAREAIILLGSPILGGRLTTKTNPEIETSTQNTKTSESFTHFPSQILATRPDTQYLDSYSVCQSTQASNRYRARRFGDFAPNVMSLVITPSKSDIASQGKEDSYSRKRRSSAFLKYIHRKKNASSNAARKNLFSSISLAISVAPESPAHLRR